jgi:hypothetical protein
MAKSTDFDQLDTLRAKVESVLRFEDFFDDLWGSQSAPGHNWADQNFQESKKGDPI